MDVRFPNKLWAIHEDTGTFTIVKVEKQMHLTHGIKMEGNTVKDVQVQGRPMRGIDLIITDAKSLENLIWRLEKLKTCIGGDLGKFHSACCGWVEPRALRCIRCKSLKSCEDKRKKREARGRKQQTKVKHKVQQLKRSKACTPGYVNENIMVDFLLRCIISLNNINF